MLQKGRHRTPVQLAAKEGEIKMQPSVLQSYSLDEKAAAKLLKVRRQTLQQWRHRGRGPKYARRPHIVYSLADIEKWILDSVTDPAEAAKARGSKRNGTRRGSR